MPKWPYIERHRYNILHIFIHEWFTNLTPLLIDGSCRDVGHIDKKYNCHNFNWLDCRLCRLSFIHCTKHKHKHTILIHHGNIQWFVSKGQTTANKYSRHTSILLLVNHEGATRIHTQPAMTELSDDIITERTNERNSKNYVYEFMDDSIYTHWV